MLCYNFTIHFRMHQECTRCGSGRHIRKEVVALQRVEGRFTLMLSGLEEFSYGESVDRLASFPCSEGGRG